MDDQSRAPRDSDRSPVRDRIKRAVAEGRISSVDGDIRLRNVDSARSSSELGLIVRDLDQLESAIAPTPAGYATTAGTIAPAPGRPSRAWIPVLVAVIVLAVLGVGAGGVLAFRSGGETTAVLSDPVPLTAEASPATPSVPSAGGPTAAAYSLSTAGIRDFIATYRHRFGTTRTVSATFYGDYVVVQVPVAGRSRHSGWVYRPGSGFTDFGGTTANFPGATAVDLAKLDVAALMRNLAQARRVLHVASANQAYVTIDYRPQLDPAPNVNIYLANTYNESGYLATRLDGAVERAYPYNAG
ncbi:MAG: DUF1707 domain-containing protein [Marmoricola sp.]